MSVIDKAKNHFDSIEVKVIEVPEWSDEESLFKVYAKPLTLAEMQKLQKFAKNDDVALMAYCLIYKCLDSDGNKIFDLNDKHDLMNNVDQSVVTRIATEIMSVQSVEVQQKK
jgi:hypothetical protein